jgi:RNA 2',3'-cyclic 3'-phosphodiesterase
VRLFVALEIAPAVRTNFAALMNDLRALDAKSSAKKPRWTRPENLHVTLKFIGNVVPEKLHGIRTALAGVRSERPLELCFRGLGFFPDGKRPRVVCAGVFGSQNLVALAADIDRGLAGFGVPSEQRLFIPHLTLARCEPGAISPGSRVAIENDAAREFGDLRATEFHLIESKLKPSGAEYTTLQSFVFFGGGLTAHE